MFGICLEKYESAFCHLKENSATSPIEKNNINIQAAGQIHWNTDKHEWQADKKWVIVTDRQKAMAVVQINVCSFVLGR